VKDADMHFDVQSYLQARTKYEYIETNFPENPDIDYVKDQLKPLKKNWILLGLPPNLLDRENIPIRLQRKGESI